MGKTYNNKIPTQLGFKYTERVVADDRTEVQSLEDLKTLVVPPYFVTFVRDILDENGLPTGYMWNGQDQTNLANWINPFALLKAQVTAYANGDGKTFTSLGTGVGEAMEAPVPADGIPFRVENLVPTADDGRYVYDSGEVDGYLKVGSIATIKSEPLDKTDDVNTYSGKRVADYLASETEATPTPGSDNLVTSGGVYDVTEAQAINIVKNYNEILVFKGFVDDTTTIPSHTYNNAYLSTANGTVLGISNVKKGQFIIDDGTDFHAVSISGNEIYPMLDPSYNKLDLRKVNYNYYLHPVTGLPVYQNFPTKFVTEFIYVKGITFINSQAYSSGSVWAYDKYKQPISLIVDEVETSGKYILPADTEWIRIAENGGSWLYLDELVQTNHDYGVTKDSLSISETNAVVTANANDTFLKSTAHAIQILSKYNSVLNFVNFVDTTTTIPSNTYNNAYLSTANGTVLGVSNVKKGQFIIDDGTDFHAVSISGNEIYPMLDPSYNKLDLRKVNYNYYLNDSTGLPVYQNFPTKFVTEFIYVKGITFINSQAYSSGSVWAYDKYKQPISLIVDEVETSGKYILPADTEWIRIAENGGSWLYLDELVQSLIPYGTTSDSLSIIKTNTEVNTKARKDTVINPDNINSMNIINPVDLIDGFTLDANGNPFVNELKSVTPFLFCKGKDFINTNGYYWGRVCFYNKDYTKLADVSRIDDKYSIPTDACYVRTSVDTSSINQLYLYVDIIFNKHYPYGVNNYAYQLKGKKLVTIGDSITFQRRWQERLCDLTGMIWDEDETRVGVGNVEIDEITHVDTGNYVRSDSGITDTGTTFVNSYGETVSIYTDGTNFYRKCLRMAEGGETVMPIAQQSIYSRCGDSKYYEPDVIIVYAGANDRGYTNWLPTTLPNHQLTDLTGLANLETDNANSTTNFEIYTTEQRLNVIGDFVADGDTQGTDKYNSNFRACYRGMMKKIIDANPEAIIICIQPHQTILYTDTTPNRIYEYVTNEVNRVIADVANEYGCQVIDMQQLFGWYNASQWFVSDGLWIHPNAAGGKKIADYISSQIT